MRTSILFSVAFTALLALINQSNAQCPQASYVCPTTPISVPTPWYELTFATDPRLATGVTTPSYSWRQTANNDTCSAYHTGMLELLGSTVDTNNPAGPWVNLTATTGSNSVGRAMPATNIGSAGSGSFDYGTRGWSFEVTFRANLEGDDGTNWAKIVSLGTNAQQNTGRCNGEWTFGWHDNSDDLTLVTCTDRNEAKQEFFVRDLDDFAWYHVVSVIQQSPNGWSTYSVYVNGEWKATKEDQQPLLDMPRDRATLGRSSWGDRYYNGTIDHFAVYDVALTPYQVIGLYGARMANCSIAVAPYTNATQPTEAVTPFFDAQFTQDITLAPGVPADFKWLASDPEDASCPLRSHVGLLTLEGNSDWRPQSVTAGPYVNLSANAGENFIGQTLNTFGAVTAGQGAILSGTAGFSIEVSFKAAFQNPFAKIFALGNADATPCVPGDFWVGWRQSDYSMEVMYCDAVRATRTIVSRGVPLLVRTWQHLVLSVQAQQHTSTTNTLPLAQWTVILDGRVVAVVSNQYMPPAIPRKSNLLGRSLYYGGTDTYWSGVIDRFAVYNRALSVAQAASLASNSGVGTCTVQSNTLFQLPANTTLWSNTWATDPRPAGAQYNWLSFDVNDTLADQRIHTGILQFGGGFNATNVGKWVNLTASSGDRTATPSNPFPVTMGGEGTGMFVNSNKGWTFEVVFKILPTPTTVYNATTLEITTHNGQGWSKVFDFGDGNKGEGRNECENDVVWGFEDRNNWMRFEVCNTVNFGSSVGGTRKYPMKINTWYHAVLTQRMADSGPIGSIYLNGEHIESARMNNYVVLTSRQDARFAASSWNDPQWNGMISYFAVHSQGVNQNQVNMLFARAFNRTLPIDPNPPSSSSSSTGASSSSSRSSSSSSTATSVATSSPATSSPATSSPATSSPATSSPATSSPATSSSATSSTGTSSEPVIDSSSGVDDGGNGVGQVSMSVMSVLLVVVAAVLSM